MAHSDDYTFNNESSIPPGIADTIRDTFINWDIIPSDAWQATCTDDFDIVLAGQHANGLDAAKAMRDAMFHATNGPLTNVQHNLKDVYIQPRAATKEQSAEGTHVIFTGTVTYTVLGGKTVAEEFANAAELQRQQGNEVRYKVKTARIYIDSVALGQALAELQKPSS